MKSYQRDLNEPSHFAIKFRRVDQTRLHDFTSHAKNWFDEKDKYLVIAAVNELFAGGRIQATLSRDADNTPGVTRKAIVGPANLERDVNGSLSLCSPSQKILVISASEIPRGPWPRKLVLVQHTVGMLIGTQFVTRNGAPIDISSIDAVLRSFAKTKSQRSTLTRRLRQLGFRIKFSRPKPNQSDARSHSPRPVDED